jgi:hypothetical protein
MPRILIASDGSGLLVEPGSFLLWEPAPTDPLLGVLMGLHDLLDARFGCHGVLAVATDRKSPCGAVMGSGG